MRQLFGVMVGVVISAAASCDTHYAARPDTNPWVTPAYPYTSPETAASYIMDAMGAADPGDTVMVLPGTYGWDGATYPIKSGVDLAGSGRSLTTMIGVVQVGQASAVSAMRFLRTTVVTSDGAMINDCLFEEATASVRPPAVVRRCTFVGETAGRAGQTLPAIDAMYGGDLRVLDCTFDLGGERDAIEVWDVQAPGLTVARSTFTRCATAICLGDSCAQIENCLFTGNELGIDTGILDVVMENCTFHGNEWAVTSGVRGYLQTVRNSILWGNMGENVLEVPVWDWDGEANAEVYMPVIEFSDVEGGYPGRANTDAAPMFLSPYLGRDLHLYSASPCIDAGNPFSGYSHEPEPNGGRINMGAYGGTWEATTSELVDTDRDNLRDDWEIEHFGTLERDGTGDADGDGLSDRNEYRYLANPNNPDTDGDGLLDGEEAFDLGTDPTFADSDNDGTPDGKEVEQGTNPLDPWDAFTIIKFWVENDQIHVVHPVQPRYWFHLESSFWPNGPFGSLSSDWEGRWDTLTHTFVANLNPHTRFFRVKARSY